MSLSQQSILQTLMQWRPRISAAAWVVVQDSHAAEDIFQNVALKAMTREVHLESEAAVLSWAFITARHEGIDWLRRHRRQGCCIDAEILALLEQEWQAEAAHPGGAKMDALEECLESASDTSRRLLRLRYYDGCSCEETARHLGIETGAIYKRLSRLHQSLKDCIEGKLAGSGGVARKATP